MKSYTWFRSIILISAILIFNSCEKDVDTYEIVESQFFETNVFGVVQDEEGKAIENALITFKTQSTVTDEFGIYLFRDMLIDSRYNSLTIVKNGYFPNTRTFRGKKEGIITLRSELMETRFDHTIAANVMSTIDAGSVLIEFDGKGMRTVDDNQIYEGAVEVAVQYLDPRDEKLEDIMPGDLSGINSNNNLRLLKSYGMVGVELRTTDGRQLQLTDQSMATLSIDIPNEMMTDAPDEIPLWHFDHENGLWVEEGSAMKNGNRYEGKVSHFSFWNFDLQRESILISGRITDRHGIGVANAYVKISRENEFRGGGGYTDFDGYFSGPIEKNATLELKLVSTCDEEEVLYSGVIGPFDSDVQLEDISLDISGFEYLSVQGHLTNCDGDVVDEGLLQITTNGKSSFFPILGGTIDKTFGICDASAVELHAIDRISLQKASFGTYEVPGVAALEEVVICDAMIDHITVGSPTYDVDLVLTDSVFCFLDGPSKALWGYDFSYDVAHFQINYTDGDDDTIAIGEFEILKLICNWRKESTTNTTVLLLDEGTLTIDDVNNNTRRVSGSYDFLATIEGLGEQHRFEGSFLAYF